MRYFKRHKLFSIVLILVSIYIYINYTSMLEVEVDRSSKYYINDIYVSDQRIYNNYLNEYEKKAYDQLLYTIKKRDAKVKIDRNDYPDKTTGEIAGYFYNADMALTQDHPELLQFGYMSYSYSADTINVKVFYSINNPVLEEINTLRIRKIINDIRLRTMTMSDKEKIKYVYEWVGNNTYYDQTFTFMAKNQSIYNAFIKGNAVCAGFSKTSQVIFQNIGIESIPVIGETSGLHMWNIIKYNGKYYFYDSTWAASINEKSEYFYNGLKQEEMNDYVLDHPEWYPKIEKESALF